MRGMTHGIYSAVFRTQAMTGLLLASWLVSMVLGRGQYASAPLIIGVIAGVISLACLWPYLTPGWLERPRRRNHLIAIVTAHLVLPLLYGFVGMSAVVAANLPDPFGVQVAVVIAVVLIATSILCGTLGVRSCMIADAHDAKDNSGVVTELVLAQAVRSPDLDRADDGKVRRSAEMSRAS